MKTKPNTPTRSKSARRNGHAGNDTHHRKSGKMPGDDIRLCVSIPAATFERIPAAAGDLEKRKPRQS